MKTGFFSLFLHIVLAVILILSSRSTMTKVGPSVYRVTIRSFSPQGDGTPLGSPIPGPPGRTAELPASPPGEKLKPGLNQKGTEKAETIKSRQKKAEKKVETVEKGWSSEKRKRSLKSLEEAIEDIDKKAALEEIQKKVARRDKGTKGTHDSSISRADGLRIWIRNRNEERDRDREPARGQWVPHRADRPGVLPPEAPPHWNPN